MHRIKPILFPMIYMLSIPAMNSLYVLLNNPQRGFHTLVTQLDTEIPYIKYFIVPYVIWYAFIFLTFLYLCIKDRKVYMQTLLTYNLGMLVCFVCYFVFQTSVPRPDLMGDDFFTKMVAYVYASDQPYNCFPSIHCLSSYIMFLAIDKVENKQWYIPVLVKGSALIIIVSTLFVKQHVLLDALAAMLLADLLLKLVHHADTVRNLLPEKSTTH